MSGGGGVGGEREEVRKENHVYGSQTKVLGLRKGSVTVNEKP